MRFLIYSLIDKSPLIEILKEFNAEIVDENPDAIITFGGDGTLLLSERDFPGIPKIPVSMKNIGNRCIPLETFRKNFDRIVRGEIEFKKYWKIEGITEKGNLLGLNDIHVHVKLPINALRFSLKTHEKSFDLIIADGIVCCTPFGSTAYYYSLGGNEFSEGIGVAINNPHNLRVKPFVLSEDSEVRVRILRGNALLFSDNNERFIELSEEDEILIRKSENYAEILEIR